MKKVLIALLAAAAGVATSAAVFAHRSQAAPAGVAAVQRTFVSTAGSDSNPCTAAQPCRSFQVALTNTTAGGEVVALDSGGYGPFTVDKSVTVAGAPGAHVAVSVFSGTGVTVNAANTDTVVLRNLYLSGLGGTTGIRFQGGRALYVDDVVVAGFNGIGLHATAPAGPTAMLFVEGSRFVRNAEGGVTVGGNVRAEIDESEADLNGPFAGFAFTGGAIANVRRSDARRNGSGFSLALDAVVAITDSVADSNSYGVVTLAGGIVDLTRVVLTRNSTSGLNVDGGIGRISASTVTGNAEGLRREFGTLETYGDNLVRGNGVNTSGTIVTVGKT